MARVDSKKQNRRSKKLTCLTIFSAVSIGSFAHAQNWQAIPLGTLGGPGSAAYGVNDAGIVVGASDLESDGFHAFVWHNGVMTDLGTLQGGTISTAFSINNAGVIVGRSKNAANVDCAVRWVPNGSGGYAIEDLGTLSGTGFGWATRINNAGQITGYSTSTSGSYHAFRWTNGTMIDLGTLTFGGPNAYSQGLGINDAGQTVGFAYATLQGPEHAFFHDGTTQRDITPVGAFSLAQGHNMNSAGFIAGYLSNAQTAGAFRAAVYDPGPRTWLLIPPLPDTTDGYAFDLNEAGDVVGTSFVPGFPTIFRGFAKIGTTLVDLTDSSTGAPGTITEGFDISNTGLISANADTASGPMALLLRPAIACVGDLNTDNTVSLSDLAVLLSHFGAVGDAEPTDGDLDADQDVDLQDLATLLSVFGSTCR